MKMQQAAAQQFKHTPLGILGPGNQGKAWALNLRDAGIKQISLGTRHLDTAKLAWANSEHLSLKEVSSQWLGSLKTLVLLIPDEAQSSFLSQWEAYIPAQTLIVYAHGQGLATEDLAQHYPQWIHALLAPKAIASELRQLWGKPQALLTAMFWLAPTAPEPTYYKEQLKQLALALGITWGPHECDPLEEYRADLFSEQTILCHYLPTLAQETFSFLMKKGIPTPLAYAEIFLELKLIANALTQMGPRDFFQLISPTAFRGTITSAQWEQDHGSAEQRQTFYHHCWENIVQGEFRRQQLNQSPVACAQERQSLLDQLAQHPLQQAFEELQRSFNHPSHTP